MEATKQWLDGRTSNAKYTAWIRTADTEESNRHSSTLLLVRYLEGLAGDLEQVERRSREVANRLRSGPLNRGVREVDARWCTQPDYAELDRVLSAVTSSPEWRGGLEEVYGTGEAPEFE